MRKLIALLCSALIATPAFAGPISSYPNATTLTGPEAAIGTQSGVTVQITMSQIATFASSTIRGATNTWTGPQTFGQTTAGPVVNNTYPGNWDSGSGGVIQRYTNRAFFGAGTLNTGIVTSTADPLSALHGAAYQAGGNALALFETTNGLDAVVAFSQSLNAQATTTPIAGVASIAALNNGSFANSGWGFYGECRFYTTAANTTCVGAEFDAVNISGSDAAAVDPFSSVPEFSTALQLACGGGFNGSAGSPNFGLTANKCSAALNIQANGNLFNAGILVDSGAVNVAAMAMPHGDALEWYAGAGSVSDFIESTAVTNTSGGSAMVMTDGATNFNNTSGQTSVALATGVSFVNQITISGSTTTNAVGFTATGSDAAISIGLNPKGAGTLKVGTSSGVSCSGSPTSSFASVDGLVTHC